MTVTHVHDYTVTLVSDFRLATTKGVPYAGPPIPVKVTWVSRKPYSVHLHFVQKDVHWNFSLDLLQEGLEKPTGFGDLKISPEGPNSDWVKIILDAPSGYCVLRARRSDLIEFLDAIQEHHTPNAIPDFDKLLQELMSCN